MHNVARAAVAALVGVVALLVPVPRAGAAPEQVPDGGAVESYIVVLDEAAGATGPIIAWLEHLNGFRARHRFDDALSGFSARLTAEQAESLRRDPNVVVVERDQTVSASDVVAPGEAVPTGVRRLAAATPAVAGGASSARVAVVDSGVDLDHPDLVVGSGVNCVGAAPPDDDNGHGTHVAGSIAATNTGAGVVGVAPGTIVVPVKVLDASGSGTWSQVICGLDWITSTRTDADASNDVAVANLSLGGSGRPVGTCATTTDPLHLAVCGAIDAGVTVVVAAGNQGWDFDYAPAPDVPAAYPEVLTVTAMADTDGLPGGLGGAPGCDSRQADDARATFSNYAGTATGAAHVIAAPGSCITSTWRDGGYATISGTSMAAPHVSGVVARCLADECAGLDVAGVVDAVRSAAADALVATPGFGFDGDPTRPIGQRAYGHLAWARPAAPPPPQPPAVPSVSVADADAGEPATGTATRPVTVTLSEPASSPVTVVYATANGTAVAPNDYTASSGTVTFPVGITSQQVNIPIVGDRVSEPDEVFAVNLSSPNGAILGDPVATINVFDPPPSLRVGDVAVTERAGGTVARYTVTLSAASREPIELAYATVDGTAIAPGDYAGTESSVTIPRGQRTATFSVPVADDLLDEATERFDVGVTVAGGRAVVADGTGTASIADNDAQPSLSIADLAVVEGTGATTDARVTVALSAPSGLPVTVSVSSRNGTAVAPGDYAAMAATRVTLSPGQTSVTVAVSVVGDAVREPNETLSVVLASAGNAKISRSTARVTIMNDDGA